jgi:hypothetical protein
MQSPQEELLRLMFWPFESFFSPSGESGAETTRLPIHAALNNHHLRIQFHGVYWCCESWRRVAERYFYSKLNARQ